VSSTQIFQLLAIEYGTTLGSHLGARSEPRQGHELQFSALGGLSGRLGSCIVISPAVESPESVDPAVRAVLELFWHLWGWPARLPEEVLIVCLRYVSRSIWRGLSFPLPQHRLRKYGQLHSNHTAHPIPRLKCLCQCSPNSIAQPPPLQSHIFRCIEYQTTRVGPRTKPESWDGRYHVHVPGHDIDLRRSNTSTSPPLRARANTDIRVSTLSCISCDGRSSRYLLLKLHPSRLLGTSWRQEVLENWSVAIKLRHGVQPRARTP
jgi:hypothetical protein